ncbi:MAG TPA: hypothetical protein PK513_05415 [Alphaproteobacteria bacterium]|nr:hypothetical protein [Alphaproteobacteria bacterium]USO05829.1 MAG: hypothetical protein H6859_01090 [Rhodospirillales bacterium]HOO81920.1 hypothetical protein [Alphaproteobacteria bacterium]
MGSDVKTHYLAGDLPVVNIGAIDGLKKGFVVVSDPGSVSYTPRSQRCGVPSEVVGNHVVREAHTGITLQQKFEGHAIICPCSQGDLKKGFSEGVKLGYLPLEDRVHFCETPHDPIELGR